MLVLEGTVRLSIYPTRTGVIRDRSVLSLLLNGIARFGLSILLPMHKLR